MTGGGQVRTERKRPRDWYSLPGDRRGSVRSDMGIKQPNMGLTVWTRQRDRHIRAWRESDWERGAYRLKTIEMDKSGYRKEASERAALTT